MTAADTMTFEDFTAHLDAMRARSAWADVARLVARAFDLMPAGTVIERRSLTGGRLRERKIVPQREGGMDWETTSTTYRRMMGGPDRGSVRQETGTSLGYSWNYGCDLGWPRHHGYDMTMLKAAYEALRAAGELPSAAPATAPCEPDDARAQMGHNGGPPLDDVSIPVPAIRITPPSNVSLREIAASLRPTTDVRAVPSAVGFTIAQYAHGRSIATLAYVAGASSSEAALAAFRDRMETCRVDVELHRVSVVVGPRHLGSYYLSVVIDGDTSSGRLPFAGHRGYANSKRAAADAARLERRTAAAALVAYEAEYGPWPAKVEADAAASAPSAAEVARTTAAHRIHIAMTTPWNGRGLPTPAALSRSLDLEDEAAAQAQSAALGIPPVRVLVLPCSATKRPDPGPLPACHRYAGPLWQTYRAAVAEIGAAPATLVLSAEFGVIRADDPIPDYNRILDHDRAVELAADPAQIDRLSAALAGATELYVTGGALYRATITAMVAELRRTGRAAPTLALIAPDGLGIGEQRAALRAWLARCAPAGVRRQAQAAAMFTPGQRIEAQRRGPAGIRWETCEIIDATAYGARVRFADGAEVPRTLDSIRAESAQREAA